MKKIKQIAKKIPVLSSLFKAFRNCFFSYRLKSKNTEQVFTDIYNKNAWGGTDSVSGRGSDFEQTRIIVNELPALFSEYNISTLLDIPCGDFHWMQNVELGNIDYIGGDIVQELAAQNNEKYGRHGIRFRQINLIHDKLPDVDLVFCRDCLVHLPFDDIFQALDNLSAGSSEYLLTTTFTSRKKNQDIATGQWRTLNLEIAPFFFPTPLKIINEGCTEEAGAFADKALALWRIADIRDTLARLEKRSER